MHMLHSRNLSKGPRAHLLSSHLLTMLLFFSFFFFKAHNISSPWQQENLRSVKYYLYLHALVYRMHRDPLYRSYATSLLIIHTSDCPAVTNCHATFSFTFFVCLFVCFSSLQYTRMTKWKLHYRKVYKCMREARRLTRRSQTFMYVHSGVPVDIHECINKSKKHQRQLFKVQ